MNMDIEELINVITNGGGSIDESTIAAMAATSLFSSIFSLAIAILMIIAMWKIFEKAGEKGWKAIIPIYNNYILFKIAWKKAPFWISFILAIIVCVLGFAITWNSVLYMSGNVADEPYFQSLMIEGGALLILCIPLAIISIVLCWKLAKAFGKGFGFFLGLLFLSIIFYCILGFGSAKYVGRNGGKIPVAAAAAAAAPVAYSPYGTTTNPYATSAYGAQPAPQTYAPVSSAPVQTYTPSTYTTPSTYAPAATYTPTTGTYEAPKTPVNPQQ